MCRTFTLTVASPSDCNKWRPKSKDEQPTSPIDTEFKFSILNHLTTTIAIQQYRLWIIWRFSEAQTSPAFEFVVTGSNRWNKGGSTNEMRWERRWSWSHWSRRRCLWHRWRASEVETHWLAGAACVGRVTQQRLAWPWHVWQECRVITKTLEMGDRSTDLLRWGFKFRVDFKEWVYKLPLWMFRSAGLSRGVEANF